MLWRIFGGFILVGALLVSLLLLSNHSGLAIKITNYFYFLLLVGVLWGLVYEAKK